MSWDRIEGQWKQERGKAVHHWGKVMNDELAVVAGKYGELVGRLQEEYAIAKVEHKRQVDLYQRMIEQLKKSNNKLMEAQKALSEQRGAHRKTVKSKTTARKTLRLTTNG